MKVLVQTKQPYEVEITDEPSGLTAFFPAGRKIAIVTDENVAMHLPVLSGVLAGAETHCFTFLAGEQSKTPETYLKILSFLAQNGFSREDVLVAFGGGVVSDLAGFAAATYLRGMRFVAVPTTLLAMIDAAVGGKNGVNLPEGKNLAGTIRQPSGVFCYLPFLRTLPQKEWANGMGEAVKYALLQGGELLSLLRAEDVTKNPAALQRVIVLCVEYKAKIVAGDEQDRGERAALNFGHTYGHALEAASGYTLPHGVAVGLGMLRVSRQAKAAEAERLLLELLPKYGLPTEEPVTGDLVPYLERDKKRKDGRRWLVVVPKAGHYEIVPIPSEAQR